jgi:hypothetical protein
MTLSITTLCTMCHYDYAECLDFYCYAGCHYVECRYAECCYAECHGDIETVWDQIPAWLHNSSQFS